MMYRLAASRSALVLFIVVIFLGVAGIMTEQISFLLASHQLDFVPAEISMEEDIAILLAAFGVFLEHRFWLLDKIYPNGVPEPAKKFDLYAQHVGILLIMIAVFIECFDMLFLAFNTWGFSNAGLKYLEVTFLFVCNTVAVLSLVKFGHETFRS
jgi:hypothetical protein